MTEFHTKYGSLHIDNKFDKDQEIEIYLCSWYGSHQIYLNKNQVLDLIKTLTDLIESENS